MAAILKLFERATPSDEVTCSKVFKREKFDKLSEVQKIYLLGMLRSSGIDVMTKKQKSKVSFLPTQDCKEGIFLSTVTHTQNIQKVNIANTLIGDAEFCESLPVLAANSFKLEALKLENTSLKISSLTCFFKLFPHTKSFKYNPHTYDHSEKEPFLELLTSWIKSNPHLKKLNCMLGCSGSRLAQICESVPSKMTEFGMGLTVPITEAEILKNLTLLSQKSKHTLKHLSLPLLFDQSDLSDGETIPNPTTLITKEIWEKIPELFPNLESLDFGDYYFESLRTTPNNEMQTDHVYTTYWRLKHLKVLNLDSIMTPEQVIGLLPQLSGIKTLNLHYFQTITEEHLRLMGSILQGHSSTTLKSVDIRHYTPAAEGVDKGIKAFDFMIPTAKSFLFDWDNANQETISYLASLCDGNQLINLIYCQDMRHLNLHDFTQLSQPLLIRLGNALCLADKQLKSVKLLCCPQNSSGVDPLVRAFLPLLRRMENISFDWENANLETIEFFIDNMSDQIVSFNLNTPESVKEEENQFFFKAVTKLFQKSINLRNLTISIKMTDIWWDMVTEKTGNVQRLILDIQQDDDFVVRGLSNFINKNTQLKDIDASKAGINQDVLSQLGIRCPRVRNGDIFVDIGTQEPDS